MIILVLMEAKCLHIRLKQSALSLHLVNTILEPDLVIEHEDCKTPECNLIGASKPFQS